MPLRCLSVVGAIIGEFFVGYGTNQYGLGYLIYLTHNQLKIDYMFAATIASTMLGMIIFGSVSWIGRTILLKWKES